MLDRRLARQIDADVGGSVISRVRQKIAIGPEAGAEPVVHRQRLIVRCAREVDAWIRNVGQRVARGRRADVEQADELLLATCDGGQAEDRRWPRPRLEAEDDLVHVRTFQARIDRAEPWIAARAGADARDEIADLAGERRAI